jgi:hypothetical protein
MTAWRSPNAPNGSGAAYGRPSVDPSAVRGAYWTVTVVDASSTLVWLCFLPDDW